MNEPFEFLDEEVSETASIGISWLPLTLKTLAVAGFLSIPVVGVFKSEKKATDWSNYVQEEDIPVSLASEENSEEGPAPVDLPNPEKLLADLASVDETLAGLAGTVPPVSDADDQGKGMQPPVTPKAPKTITPVSESDEPVAVKKPLVTQTSPAALDKSALGKKAPAPAISTKARRAPVYQQPGEGMLAAKSGSEKMPSEWVSVDETLARVDSGYMVSASQPYVEKKGFGFSITEKASKMVKPEDGETREVTVQPGDTLYGIAKRNGITTEEISQFNRLSKSDPIKPGQKLKLPDSNEPEALEHSIARPKPFDQDFSDDSIARDPYQPLKAGNSHYVDTRDGLNSPASPQTSNPLDKYNNAIAYRVQLFDNISRIADAHGTTKEELIELNGRSSVKKGEMIVVPVDACMVKDK